MHVCPHCSKQVKDLRSHLDRMHSEEKEHENAQENESENKKPETLTVKKPTHKAQKVTYHCVDCGAEFEGKPENCPGCNSQLNWEGLQHA